MMGSILCEHCTGQCCRYVALPLDKPATKRDFDDMRWYLLHEKVLIFVEDGDWYIQFTADCRHLQADNRCGIYATRPQICRAYSTKECEYHAGEYEYEHLFTEPAQLEVFAREYMKQRRARARRLRDERKRMPGDARVGRRLLRLARPRNIAV